MSFFWIKGSASDHQDLSDQIVAIMEGESVEAAALNAAGTGYTVGDVLGITETGGTANISAKIEVVTITGGGGTGPIGTVRIHNAGSYSTNPSTLTGNALTGGTGSSATIDLTMNDVGWTVDRDLGMEVTTVDSVAAGGTNYSVGDKITLTGGNFETACVLEVATLSGSAVATVTIDEPGLYNIQPSDPVAQGSTDGSGSGATFNLSFGGERQVICHGEGGGSEEIYAGWRTYSIPGSDIYNWECHGLTGYSSSLPMIEQPGATQGEWGAGDPEDQGFYTIMTSTTFNWWLSIDSFRIILTNKASSAYFHTHMGWGNRIGTSSEYPYPYLISCPSEYHDRNSTAVEKLSSITDPWQGSSSQNTVHTAVYLPGGAWQQFINRRLTAVYDDYCVVPTQRPQLAFTSPSQVQDRFMTNSKAFSDIIFSTSNGSGGATSAVLKTVGDDDHHVLLPCYYVSSVPAPGAILVEVDGCRWCNNFGSVSSEDRFVEDDGTVWRVFQNGNRTDTYAYIAIKEAE